MSELGNHGLHLVLDCRNSCMNVAVKPGQMLGAPREHGLPRPVTEAQRRRWPGFTATRTGGGSFGLGLRCSLLTDPLRDMLVVRASAQTKISLRIHARISAIKHLVSAIDVRRCLGKLPSMIK
jgi:hypothetical protein